MQKSKIALIQAKLFNEIPQNFSFEKIAILCLGDNVAYKDVFQSNTFMFLSLPDSSDDVQEVRLPRNFFHGHLRSLYGEGVLTIDFP